jgi:hypothetical protein
VFRTAVETETKLGLNEGDPEFELLNKSLLIILILDLASVTDRCMALEKTFQYA